MTPTSSETPESTGSFGSFLAGFAGTDDATTRALWETVYSELRQISGRMMRREAPDHTLQPTALVHEAFARLIGDGRLRLDDRAYFFAAAAQAMRRILIEHARRRTRAGRPRAAALDLERLVAPLGDAAVQGIEALEALEEGLDALEQHDRQAYEVVMMRFFAGLTIEQTADVMEVSAPTVKRSWTYARSWLYSRIARTIGEGA